MPQLYLNLGVQSCLNTLQMRTGPQIWLEFFPRVLHQLMNPSEFPHNEHIHSRHAKLRKLQHSFETCSLDSLRKTSFWPSPKTAYAPWNLMKVVLTLVRSRLQHDVQNRGHFSTGRFQSLHWNWVYVLFYHGVTLHNNTCTLKLLVQFSRSYSQCKTCIVLGVHEYICWALLHTVITESIRFHLTLLGNGYHW